MNNMLHWMKLQLSLDQSKVEIYMCFNSHKFSSNGIVIIINRLPLSSTTDGYPGAEFIISFKIISGLPYQAKLALQARMGGSSLATLPHKMADDCRNRML